MRWFIRTFAVLTVVSWIVVAGLFARPVLPLSMQAGHPRQQTLGGTGRLPADWSERILAASSSVFQGAPRAQVASAVPLAERYARRYGLDPLTVLAVIHVESRFDPRAVSSQGAIGLMQLQGETARDLAMSLGLQWTGDDLLFDPDVNVMLGCAYLRRLIDRFGDVDAALAAYCAGPTLVEARREAAAKIPLGYSDRVWDVLIALQEKVVSS